MISLKTEISELKNGSTEYDKAINDVLNILDEINKSCCIIHNPTGLFFNGYDSSFPKGKNTLSQTKCKRFGTYKKKDKQIIELAFNGHIIEKNGVKYAWNNVVYEGSPINQILSEFYSDTQNIPLADFSVERK